MKAAPRAFPIDLSFSRWERAGVGETIMVPRTYIFRGVVGATIDSLSGLDRCQGRGPNSPME